VRFRPATRQMRANAIKIAHLRTALEAVAENVRRHEERLRRLERRTGRQIRSDRLRSSAPSRIADHGLAGQCFDKAQAESFNAAVKVERVNRTVYPTREHARKDVARYIEFRYNRKRLHSALGYQTPEEAYNGFLNRQTAA
jgi:putative transposase